MRTGTGSKTFFWLIAISNQTSNDIDEAVDRTPMMGMLNLRDVFS